MWMDVNIDAMLHNVVAEMKNKQVMHANSISWCVIYI